MFIFQGELRCFVLIEWLTAALLERKPNRIPVNPIWRVLETPSLRIANEENWLGTRTCLTVLSQLVCVYHRHL